MKFLLSLLLVTTAVQAYVPTVESLFRHGGNPDVNSTGSSVTFVVSRMQMGERLTNNLNDSTLLKNDKEKDYFRLFYTKSGENLKLSQARYSNNTFSESSLEHRLYFPNFSGNTIRGTLDQAEKGIFINLMHSLVLNDGRYIVNYLKSLGVPVKLNSEILNREKVEFLAEYKRYLVKINKDKNARKTEVNPMRPNDRDARIRAEQIMAEPMYIDMKQVKLSRDEGNVSWMVNAGPLEVVASYKNRDIQRLKFKSPQGDFEIICKDYYLANGTHALPRYILVRTFSGQSFQVEITNLRHYNEREDDLVKRLRNWDQILKGKESTEPRPEFLL